MKKLVALLITGVMVISMMAATVSAEESADVHKIGYVTVDVSLEFCATLADAIQASADEYGWELSIADYGFDVGEMLTKAENLINSGVEAIILFPLVADACGAISDACAAAGIPLITVTSPITTDSTASILVDYYECGKMQAERALELCGPDAKYVCFQGPTEQNIFVEHREGVEEVLNGAGAEIVGYDLTENELDRGMQVMENWIQAGLEFDCLISSADGPSHGAINALQGAGIEDVVVISENGDTIGLEDIKAGTLNSTVYIPASLFGKYAVDVTKDILAGEEVEHDFYLPLEWVTADNVDEYLTQAETTEE